MADNGTQKRLKRVVTLDGHRLGHVVGAIAGLLVMIVCFFLQDADGYTTAIRVGWSFVIAYGATFLLARIILRATITEFVVDKHKKERKFQLGRSAVEDGGDETEGGPEETEESVEE